MKINKRDIRHWVFLLISGFFISTFLPVRLILKRNTTKKTVILYGHKLNGNLHSLYLSLTTTQSTTTINYYFLTLDPIYYYEIKDGYNALLAINPLHLYKAVMADCFISDHGLHTFFLLLKLTRIQFADVWHGIPFKGFIPEDFKLQHEYDEIWVSSQELKQLYCQRFGFSEKKVVVTGYGRTDLILQYAKEKNTHKNKLSIPLNKKIILFAPTWKQDNKDRGEIPFGLSINDFLTKLNAFAECHDCFCLVRYHLNTSIKEMPSFSHILFLPISSFPDSELVVAMADVLITDWSSIAFDMMVLKKPLVFLDVPHPFKNGFSLPPDYRVGDKVGSFAELERSLTQICETPEKYAVKYERKYNEVKNAVYDDTLDGKSAERNRERLEKLIGALP